MKTRAYFFVVSILLIFFCLSSAANSQVVRKQAPASRVQNEQAAIAKLRELYAGRDFEGGYRLGRKLVKQFPENTELNAWFLVNMARNEMSKEAVEAAKMLVENNKENAWAWFALANAHIRNSQTKEAIPAAEKALKLMPDDEEFIFLNASSLLMQKKYDELYVWLDKNSPKIKNQSRLLYTRAEAQYRQATGEKANEAKRKLIFETFAQAKEISPNSANANYIYGLYLNTDKRFAEAYPLLKNAVALAPTVVHVRQQFWKAILQGQPNKTEAQRKTEIAADINNFARLRFDSPKVLQTAASFYETELKIPEKQKFYETLLLRRFPASGEAEWILVNKYRAFQKNNTEDGTFKDEKLKSGYINMLRAFIKRPKHFNETLLGDAYFNLFLTVKDDKKLLNREILEIVENTAKYEKLNPQTVYPQGSLILADRKMFREAEKIARRGFEAGKSRTDSQRSFYKEEKDYQNALDWMNSQMHDALGWIFFKENRFDEAERELLQAVKLNKKSAGIFNHLGQLYEAEKDFDKAEDYYVKGFAASTINKNPNADALKSLYEKRRGSLEGFEAYFKKIEALERAARKERVVSAKIKDSKSATPFTLKNLEDKLVSFADLKGRIIVVNIWGTWCAPCVQEMPEFQELHKKYRNDKDVAILTINNDGDLALVKKFMVGKNYDFAVLRDEKYLETVSINAFPTTWFIDRDGKISFIQVGNNGKLLEEFGWRIEELKKQR